MSKTMKYLITIFFISICILVYFNFSQKVELVLPSEEEQRQELKDSLDDLKAYIVENPNDVNALEEAVHFHHVLGDFDKASEISLKLIEQYPENHMYYHAMANIKSSMEDWDEAILYRKRAHSLERSSDMLYYLATTYLAKDANYSLELLNSLDSYDIDPDEGNEFLLNYKAALEEYIHEATFETINNLTEYIYDEQLMGKIIQEGIKNSTSAEDISRLKELSENLYAI